MVRKHTIFYALMASFFMLVMPFSSQAQNRMDRFLLENRNVVTYTPRQVEQEVFFDGKGNEVRLSDFTGKLVLLNFWATWCPPCVHEMPAIEALGKELKQEGLEVIAISQDFSGPDKVRAFMQRHNIGLDLYMDNKSRLFKALGGASLPVTVFIDKEGREVARVVGVVDWESEDVKAFVRSLL